MAAHSRSSTASFSIPPAAEGGPSDPSRGQMGTHFDRQQILIIPSAHSAGHDRRPRFVCNRGSRLLTPIPTDLEATEPCSSVRVEQAAPTEQQPRAIPIEKPCRRTTERSRLTWRFPDCLSDACCAHFPADDDQIAHTEAQMSQGHHSLHNTGALELANTSLQSQDSSVIDISMIDIVEGKTPLPVQDLISMAR